MKHSVGLIVAALALAPTACVHAQSSFPTKPVRVIVPFAAGGNLDLVTRGVASRMAEGLGQQIVVDNRPGSSGLVGAQLAHKSPPDGYTLLAVPNTFAVAPSLVSNAGYDPVKDFAGISLAALVPQVLVVNPALPVRTVKELIGLAKSRPNELTYASAGVGGTGHIAGELFNRAVGIEMRHIPYKGNAQAIIDVLAGNVTLMFDQVSTSVAHVRAGKLRGLAVTSRNRSPLFPDLPTIDEAGVPKFEDVTFNGFVAPAGTPRDILVRLHAEVVKAVRTPALRDRFIEQGVELTASASPEDFSAYIKAEFEKKARLVREAGIRLE